MWPAPRASSIRRPRGVPRVQGVSKLTSKFCQLKGHSFQISFQKGSRRPGRATPSPTPARRTRPARRASWPSDPPFRSRGVPKSAPGRPKTPPRPPKRPPREPQTPPRGPKTPPRGPKTPPRGPKRPLGPSWEPFWSRFGLKFGPRTFENHWFSLGFCGFSYIFAILRKSTKTLGKTTMFKGSGVQLRPQIGPKSVPNPPPRGPGAPETAQDPPEPPPKTLPGPPGIPPGPPEDRPGPPKRAPTSSRDPP